MNSTLPRGIEWILLCLILLAAALLRFNALDSLPAGFFRDEAEKGYTALELWETGRHGILGAEGIKTTSLFPLFIEVYEGHDRTSAIYQYLAAPLVGLLGLSVYTTRLITAIAGTLVVLFGWGFLRSFAGERSALLGALLLAIHPTLLVFSRWSQQGIVALLFFVVMLFFLEKVRTHGSFAAAVTAAIAGILSSYAYDPFRLFIPLIAFVYTLLFLLPRIKPAFSFLLILVVGWLPLLLFTLTEGSARLSRVSALSQEDSASIILGNLTSFLSPIFWGAEGDSNPRHSLPYCGFDGITGWVLFALLVSAILRGRSVPWKPLLFVLGLGVLSPLAAALTNDGNPHALRALPLTLFLPFLAALAVGNVSGKSRYIPGVIAICLLIDVTRSIIGLATWNTIRPEHFERGLLPTIEQALAAPQDQALYLSAYFPYASYHALAAEKTPPALYHEQGLGALRLQLIAELDPAALPPNSILIAPPLMGLPTEFHDAFAVRYDIGERTITARIVSLHGTEELTLDFPR